MTQVPRAGSKTLVLIQPLNATVLITTNSPEFSVNPVEAVSVLLKRAKQRHRKEMTPILAVQEIL